MTALGKPEVLALEEISKPSLEQASEVLVRLQAAGINPIDTKLREKGPFISGLSPTVLGCDGAGIIEQVGSGVQDFQPGDAVYSGAPMRAS